MPRHYTPRVELICEMCGTSVMLPPSIIAQGRRCCSAKCMGAYKRRPAQFTCVGCGTTVETKMSLAAKQQYCSEACRREHEKPRITCEVCGKERRVTPTQLADGARFCSQACARAVLNKPRPVVICEQCGAAVAVPPSRVKQGMRFCSQSCRSIWNIAHHAFQSPTSIESLLYQALDESGLAYVAQYPITAARTVADAFIPSLNLVLYADGVYWHGLPAIVQRDARQMAALHQLGYRVYRLSEAALRADAQHAVQAALAG